MARRLDTAVHSVWKLNAGLHPAYVAVSVINVDCMVCLKQA